MGSAVWSAVVAGVASTATAAMFGVGVAWVRGVDKRLARLERQLGKLDNRVTRFQSRFSGIYRDR